MSVAPSTADHEESAWPEDLGNFAERYFNLPGKSQQPDGCGEWYPKEFCDSCGEPHLGRSFCENRNCPECWIRWTGSSARRIARRLGAARQAADRGLAKRAVHVVAGPPEGTVTSRREFYQMIKDGYNLAKDQGVRGGVAIPHGFRVRGVFKQAWRSYYRDRVDGGIWKWIRENDLSWEEQVYWSPHVHILGVAEDVAENSPDELGGWVCKRARTLERWDIGSVESYEDMIGTARYLLSHATYEPEESKQLMRWFGELSPSTFSPKDELTTEELHRIEVMTEEVCYDVDTALKEKKQECGQESCDGELQPIWDANLALEDAEWCDQIGRDQQRKLRAAFDWAIGDARPPAGLMFPKTEEQAQEAFDAILDGY